MQTNEYPTTVMTLPSECEIMFARTFGAPRNLVWQMWTRAEHLSKWWGPQGWTVPVCEVDLRAGGKWHYCMASPDGDESWGLGIYHEILEPERIVYTDYFSDADGNRSETMPECLVTVEFIEVGFRTTVIDTSRYQTQEQRDAVLKMGVEYGMRDTLDRLAKELGTA